MWEELEELTIDDAVNYDDELSDEDHEYFLKKVQAEQASNEVKAPPTDWDDELPF